MTTPNPFQIANTAQQMARYAPRDEAFVFNKVAMVCMGVMAAASVVQMLQPLLRELNGKRTKQMYGDDHGRGR
jgi:hypothetical protein